MSVRRVSVALLGFVLVVVTAGAAHAATWDSGSTSRVSLRSVGGQSGAGSVSSTAISTSGRYVAFTSTATNLVPNDTNGRADVFLRDRVAGTTKRINVDTNGHQFGNTVFAAGVIMSPDARYVAYSEYP